MYGELEPVKVHYQIATYSGTVELMAGENEENEMIIARAKARLRYRAGTLPFGSESWRVERPPR